MALRTIDKIGLTLFGIFQLFILYKFSILQFLAINFMLVLISVAVKLYNMYRLEPEVIRQRKEEEGLSGLWC